MFRKYLVAITVLAVGFISCVSVEFVPTGMKYTPLPENSIVAVFMDGKPKQQYNVIGVARIQGGNMNDRIEEAKRVARKNGGDAIIAKDTKDRYSSSISGDEDGFSGSTQVVEMQEFIIVRLLQKQKEKVVKKDEPREDEEEFKDEDTSRYSKKNYKNLPRATFRSLIMDYESLKGEMFRGSLYPVGFFKVPKTLRALVGSEKRLLMLSTRSGKYKLLLIVPRDMTERVRSLKNLRETMDFVYSPVYVFKTKKRKYPVLEFIDEIRE